MTGEELLMRMTKNLEQAEIYICDHGAVEGATIVAFRKGKTAWEGFGSWQGAEVTSDVSASTISLRLAHNFMLLVGSSGAVSRPGIGVIDGKPVEGVCRQDRGSILSTLVGTAASK